MKKGLNYKIAILAITAFAMLVAICMFVSIFFVPAQYKLPYLAAMLPYVAVLVVNGLLAFISANLLLDIREELRRTKSEN